MKTLGLWALMLVGGCGSGAVAPVQAVDAKVGAEAGVDGTTAVDSDADTAGYLPSSDEATLTSASVDKTGVGCDDAHTSVTLNRMTGQLRLSWCKTRAQTLDVTSWRFGRVDQWQPDVNYAPTTLADSPPDTLRWLTVKGIDWAAWYPTAAARGMKVETGFAAVVHTGNATEIGPDYRLEVRMLANASVAVDLHIADDKLRADTAADKAANPIVFLQISATASADEGFYGLGEMFDTPQHRGKIRVTQLEGNFDLDGSSNEAHVRVPLLVSTRGWGLFADNLRPSTFDVAATHPDRVDVTLEDSGLRFFLVSAGSPLDIPGRYTTLTGAPSVPARWAFGNLVWRNENKDQAEVLADAKMLRELDLPASGIWLDRPFDLGVNDFGFDPKKFPDPKAMVAQLHALGLRMGEWSTPYLDPGYGGKPKAKHFDEAKKNSWFVQSDVMWSTIFKWGPPIDFTIPAAAGFWSGQVKQAALAGVEGWKLDYGEDIVQGLGPVKIGWQFADGSDERTMHRGFQNLYHKPYAENLPKDEGANGGGGFVLSRCGGIGDQQYTSIIWPGDLCAGWVKHGECTPDGECHAGGLPASVAAAISLPTVGYPLYGADTGGYRHGRASKELYIRWLQHTALTGILQIGGSDEHLPWIPGPKGNKVAPGSSFDQETIDVSREFWRLHIRLFPLIYSDMTRTSKHQGVGPVRALGLMHPELSANPGLQAHEHDQWFLGDHLLVAPVLTEKTERQVWFPPGQWRDWFSKEVVDAPPGGLSKLVAAPLATLPLYQRAGSIVPLLRPSVDTLATTTAPGVDSFVGNPGVLWLRLAYQPMAQGSIQLYDGTAVGTTNLNGLGLTWLAGSEFTKGCLWQITGATRPKTVLGTGSLPWTEVATLDQAQACEGCWYHNAATQTLYVRTLAKLGPTVGW